MSDYFRSAGNFLFHTRNALFPIILVVCLYFWPPVAVGNPASDFLVYCGLLLIFAGQAIRMLTIGLAYIVRGGRKRRIYAENLVTDGIFAHSRNPMYVGNIMLAVGFLSVSGNLTGLAVGTVLFLVIYRLIVHSEESFLKEQFGAGYQAYCAEVPRWLPKLKGLRGTIANYEYNFDWPGVAVKEYGTILTSLMTPVVLIGWKLHLAGVWDDYKWGILALAVIIIVAYVGVRYLKKTDRLMSIRDARYKPNK